MAEASKPLMNISSAMRTDDIIVMSVDAHPWECALFN